MNPEPTSLTERALELLTWLTVEVGPRPAGSAAEESARARLAELLTQAGFRVERMPFAFAPQPDYAPYYLIAGIAFLISAGLLLFFPWLVLPLPLLVNGLPELALWLDSRRPHTAQSTNLLALPGTAQPGDIDLLLMAHIDTAAAQPLGGEFWYRWRTSIFRVMHRLSLVLALVGVLWGMGLSLPPAILIAAAGVSALLGIVLTAQDLWEQLGARGKWAPGANDNASGAALLTALAEQLGREAPASLKVGFLFTSAEETGLHGAQAAAKALKGIPARVLNVDMVGSGSYLRLITRAGTFASVRTDPALNALLERADPLIRPLAYVRRSGDFVPFLRAGFSAACIEAGGAPRFWRVYHTQGDNIEIIDRAMVDHAAEILTQLVWIMDKDKP